jgi:RecJ-like exonuclease
MQCPECEGAGRMVCMDKSVAECEECGGYGVVCDLCGLPVDRPDDLCLECERDIEAHPDPPRPCVPRIDAGRNE